MAKFLVDVLDALEDKVDSLVHVVILLSPPEILVGIAVDSFVVLNLQQESSSHLHVHIHCNQIPSPTRKRRLRRQGQACAFQTTHHGVVEGEARLIRAGA